MHSSSINIQPAATTSDHIRQQTCQANLPVVDQQEANIANMKQAVEVQSCLIKKINCPTQQTQQQGVRRNKCPTQLCFETCKCFTSRIVAGNIGSFTSKNCDALGGSFQLRLVTLEVSLQKSNDSLNYWCFVWKFPVVACNISKVCDALGASFQLWLVTMEVSLQKFVMLQVEVSISKGFVEVSSCGLWKFHFKSLWCFRWKFPFQKVLWKFPVVACGSLTSKVCDASGGSFHFKRFCGSFQLWLVEV